MLNPSEIASTVLSGHIEMIYLKCTCSLSEVQKALYEGTKQMWIETVVINLN
jgi:hypothetical protein